MTNQIADSIRSRYPNGVDLSQLADVVAVCQRDECVAEYCDLGSGDCDYCRRAMAGENVCGGCGEQVTDRPRECRHQAAHVWGNERSDGSAVWYTICRNCEAPANPATRGWSCKVSPEAHKAWLKATR